MKKLIVSVHGDFQPDEYLTKRILKKLERIFDLKEKYLEVYLVGDQCMERNVLSFPAPKNFPRPDLKKHASLGEIYLNPAYIKRNNEDFSLMLVHGFLHLLGYDHKINSDAIKMEEKEKEIINVIR